MTKIEVPDNCTLCGGSFTKDGKTCAFPWPPKHFLCVDCLVGESKSGLERLNKRLARGDINLTVEEIADEIKPRTSGEKANGS